MQRKSKIMSLSELEKAAEAIEKTLQQKVTFDNNGILFPERNYWIELNRIKTKSDLLSWVMHLSEKIWIDSRMLARFISLVCEKKKWSVHNYDKLDEGTLSIVKEIFKQQQSTWEKRLLRYQELVDKKESGVNEDDVFYAQFCYEILSKVCTTIEILKNNGLNSQ